MCAAGPLLVLSIKGRCTRPVCHAGLLLVLVEKAIRCCFAVAGLDSLASFNTCLELRDGSSDECLDLCFALEARYCGVRHAALHGDQSSMVRLVGFDQG